MALQVWLPLTKDLRNQGLESISITNNGATYNSAGKLGGCYYFNGSSTMILSSFNTTRSISFWIKAPKTNSTIAFVDYQSKMGFGFQSNGYIIANCDNTSFKMYAATNFIANEWNHVVVTRDDNLTDVTLYINGNLQTERINSNNYWTNNTDGCYIGGRSTGTYMTCYINDFRLYDHCLSPMEVKQLSQGLVLHYPLNRQGWGQENLLKNSNFLQGTNGMEGYTATSATCTKQTDCMKVVSTSASGGFYTSNFNSITTGDMTTFSAYVKANSSMIIYIGTDGSGNGSCQAYTVSTSWQKISISKAKTTNNANLRIYGNGTFYAKNLKYELGSIATPWCPNSADTLATTMGLNGITEYDCSGYCNNGTRIGTFTFNSDTPKYVVSTEYNGTDNTLIIPFDANIWQTNFTMNIWFKKDAIGSKGYETLFGGPSGFEMDTRAGTATTLSLYMASTRGGSLYTGFEFGKWYMVTLVNDGINELYYVNGELVKTIEKKSMPVGTYYIGSWNGVGSQNYQGLISDARVYATALSASDVLSLYQNNAYIDTDNIIHGAIH